MPLRRSLSPARRLWVLGLVAVTLSAAGGCGPDYKARGVVQGRVTMNRKLLTTGTVMFYAPDGRTASTGIDVDGNYQLNDAPAGDCQVTVTVQAPTDPSIKSKISGKGKGPKMPEGPRPPEGVELLEGSGGPAPPLAKMPTEVVPVDSKYSKPETSGLKFTVIKGEQQTFNIDL